MRNLILLSILLFNSGCITIPLVIVSTYVSYSQQQDINELQKAGAIRKELEKDWVDEPDIFDDTDDYKNNLKKGVDIK